MTEPKRYDVAIIGSGPAGIASSIYASRSGLSTCIIDDSAPGGQIATSSCIDNYPGLPGISGIGFGEKLKEHAEQLGTEFIIESIDSLQCDANGFTLRAAHGNIRSRAVIAALGASPVPAGFQGEVDFKGRGVSYCATCDGMFFRNKTVYVIGGGNSACEEALYLADIAANVIVIVRKNEFRAPKGLVEKLKTKPNIEIRYHTIIQSVSGDTAIEHVNLLDVKTGRSKIESGNPGSIGIFVFVGTSPNTDLVKDLVTLNDRYEVITDEWMRTSTSGLYCIGDMRATPLRQVITAMSDGALAATDAYRYLSHVA